MSKTIKNYKDLKAQIHKIRKMIPITPFHGAGMTIDVDGHFYYDDGGSLPLAPEEARRLGKFLVEFYGEEDE